MEVSEDLQLKKLSDMRKKCSGKIRTQVNTSMKKRQRIMKKLVSTCLLKMRKLILETTSEIHISQF